MIVGTALYRRKMVAGMTMNGHIGSSNDGRDSVIVGAAVVALMVSVEYVYILMVVVSVERRCSRGAGAYDWIPLY